MSGTLLTPKFANCSSGKMIYCFFEEKNIKRHKKMMDGFKCIEQAFHILAGSIVSLGDDLGQATGTIASDPWSFDT